MAKKRLNRGGTIVAARMNPKERKRIEKAAESEGISLSAVVRRAVLRDLKQLEKSA